MRQDTHEQARELIALGGSEDTLSDHQQSWLREHLQECNGCRDYSQAAGQVVQGLRSQPLDKDFALMRAMQIRLRSHAVAVQRQRERIWLVGLSCLFVGLSAAVTTPLFWRTFEWVGVRAHLSNSVWQTGFALFWTVPTLVVSVVLLVRGTYLTDRGEMQWS